MPVAPSYQSLKILSNPYKKGSKFYIKVETRAGLEKEVRFYTDTEYRSQYPNLAPEGFSNLPQVFGFKEGSSDPLLILRNVRPEDEEFLNSSPARFATFLGWYLLPGSSTSKFSRYLPHVHFVPLTKEEFLATPRTHKSAEEILKIVLSKEDLL